jgi:hypothetical protein
MMKLDSRYIQRILKRPEASGDAANLTSGILFNVLDDEERVVYGTNWPVCAFANNAIPVAGLDLAGRQVSLLGQSHQLPRRLRRIDPCSEGDHVD